MIGFELPLPIDEKLRTELKEAIEEKMKAILNVTEVETLNMRIETTVSAGNYPQWEIHIRGFYQPQ